MVGLSQKKLLEITCNAAECFIPTDKLTDEQREKLDNIHYRLCDCWRCKKALTSPKIDSKTLGHANKKTHSIGMSRGAIKLLAGINKTGLTVPVFPLLFIQTILHEIIHILFPGYGEKDVDNKAFEWLNSFNWKRILA